MIDSRRPATPQEVFTRFASRYDRMNSIASLGKDRKWRAQAARQLSGFPMRTVLDLCCGTGAMGDILRRQLPGCRLIGMDVNEAMLRVARCRQAKVYDMIVKARAEQIPLGTDSVDAVVISLGFHDLADPGAALAEIERVLRPGGGLLLLELTLPEQAARRALYVGALSVAAGLRDRLGLSQAGHVIDEVLRTPPHDHLERLVDAAGVDRVGRTAHGGGLMTSYLARKTEARHD